MPSTLYLACPAFAMNTPLERQNNIDSASWVAKEMGWEVVVSPLLERTMGNGAWLPLKERAADLKRALRHQVIWACRGGYGSIELLDTLLAAKVDHAPMLIGYSDITALHAGFQTRGWRQQIYGKIPPAATRHGRQAGSMMAALRGLPVQYDPQLHAGVRVLRAGRAQGRLFPACLSVLASVCGSAAMPDLDGTVLALEDVRIHPFLMATHLHQLYLCGALRGVRALVGGTFTHQVDHDYWGPSPEDVLAEWGQRLKIPVIARLPFGHLPDALALPFNRQTRILAEPAGNWHLVIAARD